MIITTKAPIKKTIILSSPDGNAFFLLGYAKALCHSLKIDEKKIIKEMQSSDYNNLVLVFDRYFSDHVDIIDDINLFADGN
jgi:hypothetical protein